MDRRNGLPLRQPHPQQAQIDKRAAELLRTTAALTGPTRSEPRGRRESADRGRPPSERAG